MSKQELEKIGTKAVKILRQLHFRNGQPFMINDSDLPSNHCYLEYPDGCIQLVSVNHRKDGFIVIKEDISPFEKRNLKKRYGLAS